MIGKPYDIEGVLLDIQSPKRDELRAYVAGLEAKLDQYEQAADITSTALKVLAGWFLGGMPLEGLVDVAAAMTRLDAQLEALADDAGVDLDAV